MRLKPKQFDDGNHEATDGVRYQSRDLIAFTMAWGSVNITYVPTGYTQNYKRNNVVTHTDAQAMVVAAIADSAARIGGGVQVVTNNIRQNMGADPGPNYRVI